MKTKKTLRKAQPRKTGETIVNFILDKSGSMGSVQRATISGFNEYLQTLQKDGNSYKFSLVLFDTEIQERYINEAIKDVDELTAETYVPNGGTALYDAACITIDKVKKQVKKGQKVLTVIMTDGEENSSKEFNQKDLRSRISELEKSGNWTFVFLGANQDAYANAAAFGVSKMNVSNFNATEKGVMRTMSVMAMNTSSFANASLSATSAFFSTADQKILENDDGQDPMVSKHMASLGKKSWEARQNKMRGL